MKVQKPRTAGSRVENDISFNIAIQLGERGEKVPVYKCIYVNAMKTRLCGRSGEAGEAKWVWLGPRVCVGKVNGPRAASAGRGGETVKGEQMLTC